jgi:hypothetical protein
MSAEQYYVEQDRAPGEDGDLPTYDDLAAQNGPNSRYAMCDTLISATLSLFVVRSGLGAGEGG